MKTLLTDHLVRAKQEELLNIWRAHRAVNHLIIILKNLVWKLSVAVTLSGPETLALQFDTWLIVLLN